jgi:hypothetical protein
LFLFNGLKAFSFRGFQHYAVIPACEHVKESRFCGLGLKCLSLALAVKAVRVAKGEG